MQVKDVVVECVSAVAMQSTPDYQAVKPRTYTRWWPKTKLEKEWQNLNRRRNLQSLCYINGHVTPHSMLRIKAGVKYQISHSVEM